jgi:DNA-binding MarR family transcriptional regulator
MESPVDLRQVFDDLVRFETELWNAIDARLRVEAGIPLGTFNLLLVVEKTDDCRVNDIAEKLAITVGGVSQAVDRIEGKGLCIRRQDAKDGRSSVVSLTALGSRKLSEATPVFDDELGQWFEAGGTRPQEFRQFIEVLALLRTAGTRRKK